MKIALVVSSTLSILFAGILGFQVAMPAVASGLWAEDYKDLMYECDNAMREHFIAKKAVEFSPSAGSVALLNAAELSLMSCHDYDKLRKRLISWGLDGNALSVIGLEAIEEKAYELQHFVQIHEFRYE